MSKKQVFINYLNAEFFSKRNYDEIPEDVRTYWEGLNEGDGGVEKSKFTDNGKLILQYMIDHQEIKMWKAKDLADGLLITSRQSSGAMRKLVSDGYVEKIGENPVVYTLTDFGKNTVID